MDGVDVPMTLTTNQQSSPKFPLKICYHEIYANGIHPDARFPRDRYVKLLQQLTTHSQTGMFDFVEPKQASKSDLLIAHDSKYVNDFLTQNLTEKEIRRIGLTPWTQVYPENIVSNGRCNYRPETCERIWWNRRKHGRRNYPHTMISAQDIVSSMT